MLKDKFGKDLVIGRGDALAIIDMNKDLSQEGGALFIRGIKGEVTPEELIDNLVKINTFAFGYRVAVSAMYEEGHFEFEIYPKHCLEGTSGQEWPEKLLHFHDNADCLLVKGTEPGVICTPIYTCKFFFDLVRKLRERGITRIFCGGLSYTDCLGEAAIAFSVQGFEVYVVRNAARSVPPPRRDAEKMKSKLILYDVKEAYLDDQDFATS